MLLRFKRTANEYGTVHHAWNVVACKVNAVKLLSVKCCVDNVEVCIPYRRCSGSSVREEVLGTCSANNVKREAGKSCALRMSTCSQS